MVIAAVSKSNIFPTCVRSRILHADWMPFGVMVTLFAWMAHKLVSLTHELGKYLISERPQ